MGSGNYSCRCKTSSTRLSYKKFTSHSDICWLAHVPCIRYILLHHSIWCSSSRASKRVVLLAFKLLLQLLFWIDIWSRVCILFFINLGRMIDRLFSGRLYLPHVASFFIILRPLLLLLFFHLPQKKRTCCLKISPYLCFYYFESIFLSFKTFIIK